MIKTKTDEIDKLIDKMLNTNFNIPEIVSGDVEKMKIELLVGDSTTFIKILKAFMKRAIIKYKESKTTRDFTKSSTEESHNKNLTK